MHCYSRLVATLTLPVFAACGRDAPPPDESTAALPDARTAVSAVSDSLVIDVEQLTLIGFHPFATDSMLERDEDLATILDDFGYHLSEAMATLRDSGWAVDTRIADTLYFRAADRRWTWVRPLDRVNVGYVLTAPSGAIHTIFGVRSYVDLITAADSFARGSRR